MEAEKYSKVLSRNDIEDRLTVPQLWMNLWDRLFQNGEKEATVSVLCWLGYAWEFRCSIRDGPYKKPVLQAPEWQRFVKYLGLQEGDKIILGPEKNCQRGLSYNIKVQRKDADGPWVDMQPPQRAAPYLIQFRI